MSGHEYYSPDPMPMGVGMAMSPIGMGMGYERVFPCVRLRGLPFHVSEDEIRLFLGGETVDILMVKREGRFSGEAYVVLASPMAVDMALTKNKSYMGRRYIEIFKAKKLDYYRAVVAEMTDGPVPYQVTDSRPRRSPAYGGDGGSQNNGVPTSSVLRLRGLPFSVNAEDIVSWFNDGTVQITPITTESVFIVTDYGRPSGLAFVDFASPEDAHAAMTKDRQMMGTRYIEIFASTGEERARYSGY
ncbi:hypothetical protein BSKO_00015 [Bryopsis sp. KO-2023]|nr:hypothetical protein BSKO_00015 [Bryopsis sp. KO-2023]